jgi:NTP pyrophosphatase (non-canonical NTP hydrolase)
MTIQEAQAKVDAWINQYGVRYFNELTNMAILTEEVGEVARIIARTYGEQTWKMPLVRILRKKPPGILTVINKMIN